MYKRQEPPVSPTPTGGSGGGCNAGAGALALAALIPLAVRRGKREIGANKHRMRHKPVPECPRRMENTAPVLRDRLI